MRQSSTDGFQVTIVLNANRAIDIELGRASPHLRDERIVYEGRAMGVGPIFMIILCPGMGMQVPELGKDELADVVIDLHSGESEESEGSEEVVGRWTLEDDNNVRPRPRRYLTGNNWRRNRRRRSRNPGGGEAVSSDSFDRRGAL